MESCDYQLEKKLLLVSIKVMTQFIFIAKLFSKSFLPIWNMSQV